MLQYRIRQVAEEQGNCGMALLFPNITPYPTVWFIHDVRPSLNSSSILRIYDSNSQYCCLCTTHLPSFPESLIMPVPRKRPLSTFAKLTYWPRKAMVVFDISFVYQTLRPWVKYGFMPAVLYLGMTTEPRPSSWWDIINILE